MSRALRFSPFAILVIVIAALIWRLGTPTDTNIHSALEGRGVPAFSLAPIIPGKPTLSSSDLANGEPHLVNVFASWCVPCVAEVGILKTLQGKGVHIDGIAVRDRTPDLQQFLSQNGDPYDRIGSDPQSAVQISLGSSGVPESFIIDGKGVIRYQKVGAIDASDVALILSKLEQAR